MQLLDFMFALCTPFFSKLQGILYSVEEDHLCCKSLPVLVELHDGPLLASIASMLCPTLTHSGYIQHRHSRLMDLRGRAHNENVHCGRSIILRSPGKFFSSSSRLYRHTNSIGDQTVCTGGTHCLPKIRWSTPEVRKAGRMRQMIVYKVC